MTLACLDISSKKRCLYRLFIYHFKEHTISNNLVAKVFAQKKGEKVMTATNMCSNFSNFRCRSLKKGKTLGRVREVMVIRR